MSYEPNIRKFSGQEDSARWKADFISEIGGPGGPAERMKHVYFSRCLEGAALEWYCNDLEYRAKVYWDILSAAFDTRWKPTASNIPVEPPAQTTIFAPADTATPAIYETTTTSERLDRATDVQHVTPALASVQVRTEVELTHTAMPTPAAAQLETDSIESNAPVQTQSRVQPVTTTTTATATDSNNTATKIGQRDNAEPTEDREEKQERRAEERERRAEE